MPNLLKDFEVDAKNPSLEARQRCQIQVDHHDPLRIVNEEVSKFPDLKLQLDVKISGGMDLDILLKKVKSEEKFPVNTLACGDSENAAELFTMPDVSVFMVGVNQKKKRGTYLQQNSSGIFIGFFRRLFGKPAAGCKGEVVLTETIIPIPPYMPESGDNTEPAPRDMQEHLPSRNLARQLSISDGIHPYHSFKGDSNHPNSPS